MLRSAWRSRSLLLSFALLLLLHRLTLPSSLRCAWVYFMFSRCSITSFIMLMLYSLYSYIFREIVENFSFHFSSSCALCEQPSKHNQLAFGSQTHTRNRSRSSSIHYFFFFCYQKLSLVRDAHVNVARQAADQVSHTHDSCHTGAAIFCQLTRNSRCATAIEIIFNHFYSAISFHDIVHMKIDFLARARISISWENSPNSLVASST